MFKKKCQKWCTTRNNENWNKSKKPLIFRSLNKNILSWRMIISNLHTICHWTDAAIYYNSAASWVHGHNALLHMSYSSTELSSHNKIQVSHCNFFFFFFVLINKSNELAWIYNVMICNRHGRLMINCPRG